MYSMIHYTSRPWALVEAGVNLLKPGGRLLIGDIPNRDAKARFLDSPAGREFAVQWEDRKALINDLDAALDEFNTLVFVQEALEDATGGFLFNTWNGRFPGRTCNP